MIAVRTRRKRGHSTGFLVSVIGSKEITKPLGTSDRAEAVTRCRLEGVRLDAEWSALSSTSKRCAPPPRRLSAPRS
jgi:hypothetical protein